MCLTVNSATVPSGGGSPSQMSVSRLSTTKQPQGVNMNRKRKNQTAQKKSKAVKRRRM